MFFQNIRFLDSLTLPPKVKYFYTVYSFKMLHRSPMWWTASMLVDFKCCNTRVLNRAIRENILLVDSGQYWKNQYWACSTGRIFSRIDQLRILLWQFKKFLENALYSKGYISVFVFHYSIDRLRIVYSIFPYMQLYTILGYNSCVANPPCVLPYKLN